MRRRPDHLIRNLFTASLIILAGMHPETTAQLAQLGTSLLLGIVNGIAQAAAQQPGPALLTAGAIYIAHQIRTHRPRARAHA
ncbi:hypothetical protein [Streptomyces sp. XY006]|uniref:hypothetical protein n=1 Tax=Streptomyces sp. XY006 TaxID=2021410 RepID=UPI000B8C0B71|nr:hypothetical protein [Streptomyces sp. XY006]OXS35403.1 hypothetical protein CHR28_10370 [Streptomyces sp. XY006]